MNAESRPVAEGIYSVVDGEVRLLASTCNGCAVTTFPTQASCPKCTGQDVRLELLPSTGTLWSFTTQGFLPKNPPYGGSESAENFVPFGVGYVALGNSCKVEGRLTVSDVSVLEIGMAMTVVSLPLRTNPDGTEVLTYAFAPAI